MSELMQEESKKPMQLKEINVPIRFNDICVFDGAYTFLKERFGEELRRMDDEMTNFSKMLQLYTAGVPSDREVSSDREVTPWETLSNSPLIEGEGDCKTLTLQFDVSQFEPEEVAVRVLNKTLVVTAQHEEKSDSSVIYNQFLREFNLPSGIASDTMEAMLSKDGVLTVKAALDMKKLSG